MSWATSVAALSPTNWWRLNETSSNYTDSGSGGVSSTSVGAGVTRGATGLVSGDSDKAASFTAGTNAYIDFGDAADLDGGSYTVMLAFKFDGSNSSNYQRLVHKLAAADGFEIGLYKSTDTPANCVYFDHRVSSTTKEALSAALTSNTTYLAFCVYDDASDNMKVYVNGSQSGSTLTGVTSNLTNNTATLVIGNSASHLLAASMSGTIDEVAFWKGTALSSTNVSDLTLAFQGGVVRTHTADGIIAARNTKTYTADGIVTDPPTLSTSGTLLGVTLGADAFGRVIFKATEGTLTSTTSVSAIERSSDGSSYSDITSHCTTHKSGSAWLISDNRPDKGTQSISAGGTAYYRVKLTDGSSTTPYSSALSIGSVGITKATVAQAYAQTLATYIDTSANANTEADGAYPGVFLTAFAYAEYAGYTPSSSTYIARCSSFWSLVKSRGNINADYLHTPATYSGSSGIRRDFHWRLVMHILLAARILRRIGGSTANTLAADMEDYANRMGKAAFDKLSRGTCVTTKISDFASGSDGYSIVTAWSAGASITAGEVRKPTSPVSGSRIYRAQNSGTTGGSQPSWPTTSGATVTDNGITWKEMSTSVSVFSSTYSSTSPYSGANYTWDGNQISETAAALLLLRTLGGSDFYPGGSYATTGYNHAVDCLNLCAVFQYTDGAIPVGDAYNTRDTHYGSFQLHTTAIAQHLLGTGVLAQMDLWLTRALSWFTNTYSTEPNVSNATANGAGGGYSTYHRLAEPVWRAAGYTVAGQSDPLDGLYYRSSYVQSSADVQYTQWGYSPENALCAYPYFFEALADYTAVLGTVDKTYTADGIIKTGRDYTADGVVVTRNTKTYTADAIVNSSIALTLSKTYTADGVVIDPTTTKTYTADAIVLAGTTKTHTADAVIVATITVTTRTRSIGADALVITAGAQNLQARIGYWLSRRRSKMQQKKSYFKLLNTGTTRTTSYTSGTLDADVEPGVVVFLDVTDASGTGGLTVRINAVDGASGKEIALNTAPTAVTSTGQYTYAVYPFGAISGNLTQSTSGYLPTQFSVTVTAGDSSSYTYSLGYCLLP